MERAVDLRTTLCAVVKEGPQEGCNLSVRGRALSCSTENNNKMVDAESVCVRKSERAREKRSERLP